MAEELETKVEETVVAENTESTENKRENNVGKCKICIYCRF